jgi:hypothetical protein
VVEARGFELLSETLMQGKESLPLYLPGTKRLTLPPPMAGRYSSYTLCRKVSALLRTRTCTSGKGSLFLTSRSITFASSFSTGSNWRVPTSRPDCM